MPCYAPPEYDGNRYQSHRFLLLRIVDFEERVFERMGMGKSYLSEVGKLLHRDLAESVKSSLPCLHYEDGGHAVRVR